MADLAYSGLPVAGATNNASDVITPLNEVKSYVNGNDWVNGARIAGSSIVSSHIVDGTIVAGDLNAVNPGRQVASGLATSTSDFTTTSTAYVDVTGMEITVTGDNATAMWLEFSSGSWYSATGVYSYLELLDVASGSLQHANAYGVSRPVVMRSKVAAFSGAKTFKVRLRSYDASLTGVNNAGDSPRTMYLRATWDG